MNYKWRQIYLIQSKMNDHHWRVYQAKRTIDRFLLICDRPYLSFSGGKDSSAMLVLFYEIGATDIPVLTQADDMDWPFKRGHCHKVIQMLGFSDYTYQEASDSVSDQVFSGSDQIDISDLFYGVISDFASKRNRNGFCMGIRAQESVKRRITIAKAACRPWFSFKDGLWRAYPMGNLTGEDVFAILLSRGVPYAEIYDKHGGDPPHSLRFSWYCNPEFFHRGQMQWLKKYYPEMWQGLVHKYPKLSVYA